MAQRTTRSKRSMSLNQITDLSINKLFISALIYILVESQSKCFNALHSRWSSESAVLVYGDAGYQNVVSILTYRWKASYPHTLRNRLHIA